MTGTYVAPVRVFNTTGANATLIGWFDYNGNGVFDASEACTPVTVTSAAGMRTFNLVWTGIVSPIPNTSYTYLRIRITSSAYGMNANNATGYYDMGEVEDYRVIVDDFPLAVSLISFDANAVNNTSVNLHWSANEDSGFPGYELQRTHDGSNWETVTFIAASGDAGTHDYSYMDFAPYKGVSWYRLKLRSGGTQQERYSDTRMVRIGSLKDRILIAPNPASDHVTLIIDNADGKKDGTLNIWSTPGVLLKTQKLELSSGINTINLPIPGSWPTGTYIIQVMTANETTNRKLILRR